jgi:hypothetical protein
MSASTPSTHSARAWRSPVSSAHTFPTQPSGSGPSLSRRKTRVARRHRRHQLARAVGGVAVHHEHLGQLGALPVQPLQAGPTRCASSSVASTTLTHPAGAAEHRRHGRQPPPAGEQARHEHDQRGELAGGEKQEQRHRRGEAGPCRRRRRRPGWNAAGPRAVRDGWPSGRRRSGLGAVPGLVPQIRVDGAADARALVVGGSRAHTRPGTPSTSEPAGTTIPSRTTAPAPTMLPRPITARLSTTAPMPIRQSSLDRGTVHHGAVSDRDARADGAGHARVGVQHAPVLHVALRATVMRSESPRSTANGHTLAAAPSATSRTRRRAGGRRRWGRRAPAAQNERPSVR